MKTQTYTVIYETDGYNCTHERRIEIRAKRPENALANALRKIGAIRGAIASAKRDGGRVRYGVGGYSRNLWAWTQGFEQYIWEKKPLGNIWRIS